MPLYELLETLIRDIARFVPEFAHIDPDQMVVMAIRSRKRKRGGVVAYLLPLRFKGGATTTYVQKGRNRYHYQLDTVQKDGRPLLYAVYFMIPRFLALTFSEKVETVVHELYHVSPRFDGDLRRFTRARIHGPTEKEFAREVKRMAENYLSAFFPLERIPNLKPLVVRRPWKPILGRISGRRPLEFRPKLIKVETICSLESGN